MTKPKYRVAIIGTGRMGGLMEDENPNTNQYSKPYGHFSAYGAIEQTEVVAVANRGAQRLEIFAKRFGVTNTYRDYREMIDKEQPDIVSVTTQSFARAEPIIYAAEHGVRGIYSEKGLCASLAEADRIRAACKANNVAFNWGAMRRNHDGYIQLREAIARGDIGEPKFAIMSQYTDLIKHHPHTVDAVAMLLGDPAPVWVEGHLVEKGDPLDPGDSRKGPRFGPDLSQRLPMPIPDYDPDGHRFLPPPDQEIADPFAGFFRVGYESGAEGAFLPLDGRFELDIIGSAGRAYAWDNGEVLKIRRGGREDSVVEERTIRPKGESPTVSTIRDIIRELETGQRTAGNIDVTMQAVEVQFGVAYSHLQGGARVQLPVADRSLYIPGG